MKKIKVYFIIICFIIFSVISCSIMNSENEKEKDKSKKDKSKENTSEENMSEDVEEATPPIERIDLGNKQFIEYYELEPGSFMTVYVFDSFEKAKCINGKTPLEVYEFFKGSLPSTELKNAYLRSISNDQGENDTDEEIALSPKQLDPLSKISAGLFAELYYYPEADGHHVSILWADVTGTGSYSRKCSHMQMITHPYRGTITFSAKYKNRLGTKTHSNSVEVSEGCTAVVTMNNSYQSQREVKVYNADGDGYHACIFASK